MTDEALSKKETRAVNPCLKCSKRPHWRRDIERMSRQGHCAYILLTCDCRAPATQWHWRDWCAIKEWNAMNPADGSKPYVYPGILNEPKCACNPSK